MRLLLGVWVYIVVVALHSANASLPVNIDQTTLVKQTIQSWLDTLSKENREVNLDYFTGNVELDLLSVSDKNSIPQMIWQRKQEFIAGVYSVQDMKILYSGESVEVNLILDWIKTDIVNVEKARFSQLIKLVYSEAKQRFLINSISENFRLPTDGIEAKLKC